MPRFNLPDIDFVVKDVEEIETEIVTNYENLTGITLNDVDPRRIFIKSLAYGFFLQRNNIDYTAKQRLIAYAEDNFLDHLGADDEVERNEPIAATTTIRFEVNPLENFTIPAGTQMKVGDDIFFESSEDTPVTHGMQTVDVEMQCTETGTIGNGFLPGQITDLVNPIPWVSKAYNITTSSGGADWEEDDPYADRIRKSKESYSTAGPEGAYEYWAKSANQLIIDVDISSPSANVIEIRPLLKDGKIPDADVLQQVGDACNDRKIRPLTDQVKVLAPDTVQYDIDVTYYISNTNNNVVDSLKTAIEAALQDYIVWQRSKLGRGIDTSELITRMKNAGAYRVQVNSPTSTYTQLLNTQVAKEGTVTVTYGGIVDD